MSSIQSQTPPEAAGPGTYDEQSGAVRYGDGGGQPRIGPIPPRDSSARYLREPGKGHAVNVTDAPGHGCGRCQDIPDAVLIPLRAAVGRGAGR